MQISMKQVSVKYVTSQEGASSMLLVPKESSGQELRDGTKSGHEAMFQARRGQYDNMLWNSNLFVSNITPYLA